MQQTSRLAALGAIAVTVGLVLAVLKVVFPTFVEEFLSFGAVAGLSVFLILSGSALLWDSPGP